MRGGLLDGCWERDLPGAAGTGRVDIALSGGSVMGGIWGMVVDGGYVFDRICIYAYGGGLRVLALLIDLM
jgi:hypothetical protein